MGAKSDTIQHTGILGSDPLSPTAFAPAHDGYCSWAASQGFIAPGDPLIYEVVDGQLYLQVHPRAQELWEADIPAHIAQGDENWPRINPF